jgi:hypothetical protein
VAASGWCQTASAIKADSGCAALAAGPVLMQPAECLSACARTLSCVTGVCLQVITVLHAKPAFFWTLLVNSCMAYAVNLTNFMVTKYTSALTLQVGVGPGRVLSLPTACCHVALCASFSHLPPVVPSDSRYCLYVYSTQQGTQKRSLASLLCCRVLPCCRCLAT